MNKKRFIEMVRAEAQRIIDLAAQHGITLSLSDFGVGDDGLTLDGMPAEQWLDAMTMD